MDGKTTVNRSKSILFLSLLSASQFAYAQKGALKSIYEAEEIGLPADVEYFETSGVSDAGEVLIQSYASGGNGWRLHKYGPGMGWGFVQVPEGYVATTGVIAQNGNIAGEMVKATDPNSDIKYFLFRDGKSEVIDPPTQFVPNGIQGVNSKGEVLFTGRMQCAVYHNGKFRDISKIIEQASCAHITEDGTILGNEVATTHDGLFEVNGFILAPDFDYEVDGLPAYPHYPFRANTSGVFLVKIATGVGQAKYGIFDANKTDESDESQAVTPFSAPKNHWMDEVIDINNSSQSLGNSTRSLGVDGEVPVEALLFRENGKGLILRSLIKKGPIHKFTSVSAQAMSKSGDFILVKAYDTSNPKPVQDQLKPTMFLLHRKVK